MRTSTNSRARLVVAAIALAFVTTACGSDSESAPPADSEAGAETAVTETAPDANTDNDAASEDALEIIEDALAGPDEDGDDGRAFGASDEIVIEAVEKTFSNNNAKAEWSGSTLRVSMDGSVEDLTGVISCPALEGLLADGEEAVIVFSDGEVACAEL